MDTSELSDSSNNIDETSDNEISDNSIDTSDNDHNNHSFSILEFIVNCFLHISILFFFLYILFVIIITPLEKKVFKNELGDIINNIIDNIIPNPIDVMDNTQLDTILNNINGYSDLKETDKILIRIQIQQVYNYFKLNPYILNNYINEYQNENFLIKAHNDHVMYYGQAIVISLFIITTLLIIIIKYFYPTSINITNLLIENIITFMFIGAGEYMFFMNYAKNFVPAPPSLLSKTAIDNLKDALLK